MCLFCEIIVESELCNCEWWLQDDPKPRKDIAKYLKNRPAVNSDLNTLLAEKIATSLLIPYNGEECTRMQLMLKQDGVEKNMGGRNKQNMIDTILECLNGAPHESA